MSDRIKQKFKKLASVNVLVYIVLSVLLVFSFSYHIDGAFSYKTDVPTSRTVIQMESGRTYFEVLPSFPDGIRTLGIRFGTNIRTNDGVLTLRLLEGGSEVRKWEISTAELADRAIQVFEMGRPYYPDQDETITLELTDHYESGTDNNIAVYISSDGFIDAGTEKIQESFVKQWTLINSEQARRFKPIYISLAVLLFIAILFAVDLHRIKWSKLILATVVLFLIIQFVDYDLFESINSRVFIRAGKTVRKE